MKHFASLLLAAAAATLTLPASAQFAKPEDAIKYRKASMTLMAAHFGRVAAMASGRAPFDAKLAADNAAVAEAMLAKGIYVVAFSYPVVPVGQARIRTQVSAAHTEADIDAVVAAFTEVCTKLGVGRAKL